MSIFTQRLGVVEFTAAGNMTLHTAAAGFVTILRDIVITNHGTAPLGQMLLFTFPPGGGPATYLYMGQALPVGTVHIDLRQEIKPGEQLGAQSSGGAVAVWTTGYILQP